MTLRTDSLRIDPVAVAFDGQRVVAVEQRRQSGDLYQSTVAWPIPGVAHHHDGRGALRLAPRHELGLERLDSWIGLIVEEVEVVEKARGLPQAEAQERVETTFGDVEHLHGVAGAQQRAEVTRE